MTPAQFEELLNLLHDLAAKNTQYTITGASDWPMLMVLGGILAGLIGFMWVDLRSKLTDHKVDFGKELDAIKAENKEGHDILWNAMRDCQNECCPRKKAT